MITLKQVSLQLGTKTLFDKLNFTLHDGQKVGLIGVNGSGKSTLFALLQHQVKEDAGDVYVPANWVVGHLEQEVAALNESALDYVLRGDAELTAIQAAITQAEQADDGMKAAELHIRMHDIDGYTAPARAARLLSGLGFAAEQHNATVASFSGGWRMRLNLARTLMQRSDLLLLDEPTNHLDLEAIVWLEQWLRSYRGSMIIISHDRDFLDNVVDGIAHLDQHQIRLYTGNYSAFERARAEYALAQQQAVEKVQQQRAHLQQFIDRFRAKATKARQAQSRIKALERLPQIQAAHIDSPFNFTIPEPLKQPNPLLQVRHATVGYKDKTILQNIEFTLAPGERIGLLGLNGAGKSTFIKLLAGELNPAQGEMYYHPDTKIGYFAQHQLEKLRMDSSPLQHLQRLSPETRELELRTYLGSFNFKGDHALTPITTFSGGEKSRLALALLVWQRPNVLLLDEPTNHLDREMREALTQALQTYEGAIVVVSHDRHLLRSTCDELFLIENGSVSEFANDLDAYLQWRQQQNNADSKPNAPVKVAKPKNTDPQQRKVWQNRIKTIETRIPQLQADIADLHVKLGDASLYEEAQKNTLDALTQKQQGLQATLAELEEEYLDLLDKLE
jgi:ATP-binding cassette subfamily F protein 3